MKGTPVVIAAACATGVSLLVNLALARDSGSAPRPTGDEPNLELLNRLDELERRLARRGMSSGSPLAQSTPPRDRVVVSPATDDRMVELTARLDALEQRIDDLGDDPIIRARGYLESASPEARREGIELLARFAEFDQEARDAIRARLSDEDPGVRREALEALGRAGDRESLSQIQSMLADENSRVRGEAAEALRDLLEDMPRDSAELRAGVAALAARATDGDARVREEIADSLGELGSGLATPTLIGMLNDSEDDVREEAIQALGRSDDPAAIGPLRQMFDSAEPGRQRLDLAIALARLGDRSAFAAEAPALIANATNQQLSARERMRAIWMLGSVDANAYRTTLMKALNDPSERVRREAREILEDSGR